jgi:hypothetical protein
MRDIRSDLEERANLIEEEIEAVVAHFEQAIQPLQSERDARLAELKTERAALGALIEAERRRLPEPRPIEAEHRRLPEARPIEPERQRAPSTVRQGAVPRQSLGDFLARKLAEIGPRSTDDLNSIAVQEGYFPDTARANPGVHATLVDLLRNDRIRQLPDGTLALATVSQMIRRQAV